MSATTIERFDVTVGPFTFQARAAGPTDGRAVILLHGVPQTSACWIRQLDALADGYRAKSGDGNDQHERSGYMREIVGRPRGEMEQLFVGNDAAVMRMMFAGLPDASVDEYVEILGSPEAMRGVLDWYRAGALAREQGSPRGMDPDFPDIEIPTLYIWSDQDPAIGPAGAYATAEHVAGSYRFVVFEGVDHWIQEREPERFNQELLAHLAAHPA